MMKLIGQSVFVTSSTGVVSCEQQASLNHISGHCGWRCESFKKVPDFIPPKTVASKNLLNFRPLLSALLRT